MVGKGGKGGKKPDQSGKVPINELIDRAAWDAAAEGEAVPAVEGAKFRGHSIGGIVKGPKVNPEPAP